MKKRFENAVAEYIKAFTKKHDIEFDGWVADQIGTVGMFADYYFDLEDIRRDLDQNMTQGDIFKWYDMRMQKKHEHLNYYSYCLKDQISKLKKRKA